MDACVSSYDSVEVEDVNDVSSCADQAEMVIDDMTEGT
jgi:hypothetical protein